MDDFINFPLLSKLLVVAILTPAWLPIIRALWHEVNDSLIEQGGIFGDIPEHDQAVTLAKQRQASGESLCSLSKEEHRRRHMVSPAIRTQGAGKTSSRSARPRATGALRNSNGRGF